MAKDQPAEPERAKGAETHQVSSRPGGAADDVAKVPDEIEEATGDRGKRPER